MKRLIRFLRTSPAERRLFAFSVAAMAVTRIALVLFPFRHIVNTINSLNRRWPRPGVSSIELHRAALRINQAAACCPTPTTCLSRTLAAHFLMSRLGFPSIPKIGVSKAGGNFAAHAWLECPQEIVIGHRSPDGNFYHPVPALERFFQ